MKKEYFIVTFYSTIEIFNRLNMHELKMFATKTGGNLFRSKVVNYAGMCNLEIDLFLLFMRFIVITMLVPYRK